jgi:DNA-binding transcriptional MerR regulator
MNYTVNELAKLASVSVRTLHHYDAIGLLSPQRHPKNEYRLYDERDLLLLQQILFFRELEFSLDDIKKIVTSANFDIAQALKEHKTMIMIKKRRIDELLTTIDKTISKVTKLQNMEDKELYEGFSKEELDAWNKEAKERWGDTEQYKQSVGKYESLTKEQKLKMQADGDALMRDMTAAMGEDPASETVQALVQRHYDALRFFYEPNPTMYRNLADMYVGYQGDTRYRAYFEKYDKKLPEFMRDAIHIYCDRMEGRGKS